MPIASLHNPLPLLQKHRSFHALGLDIDPSLISRARRKYDTLGNRVEFDAINVADSSITQDRLQAFLRKHNRDKFDLITLFSVTMWLHVHNGDDGLRRILKHLASLTGKGAVGRWLPHPTVVTFILSELTY